MDSLDLFFKKYSYKFNKGYPDMNNNQDVLLLESLLNKLGVNLNEAFQDSSDLPSDISNLKQQIQDASGELSYEIEAIQKSSSGDYFLYFKGLSRKNREERKNITQELIDKKILTPTNPNSPINKNKNGAYYTNVTIGGKSYIIYVGSFCINISPYTIDLLMINT